MLSEAKHLVFRDSSVAFGSLRMTGKMTSHHLLVLKLTSLDLGGFKNQHQKKLLANAITHGLVSG
jgi:hypothetical protein